jgi:hypothetical protein
MRDLIPRNVRLIREHLGGQSLHGFSDFQQPDPNGVENQVIGHVTALHVGADGVDRRLAIG